MLTDDTVLAAISSTEESSFNELCSGLGADCPTNRDEWRELFQTLNRLEQEGLVEISRAEKEVNGRTQTVIDSLILTESGGARVRALLDSKRGLFQSIE